MYIKKKSTELFLAISVVTISLSTAYSADLAEKRPAPGTPAGGTNSVNTTTNRPGRPSGEPAKNTPPPTHGDSPTKREAQTKGVPPKPKVETVTKPEAKSEVKTGQAKPATPVTNVPVAAAKEEVRLNKSEQAILEKELVKETEKESSKPSKGKKGKRLPPGLEKKAAKGGELPPGWQKKVSRGEVLPPEVMAHAEPLPDSVAAKLPPQPMGTVLRKIDDKVVRVRESSREILDVIEIGGAKKN